MTADKVWWSERDELAAELLTAGCEYMGIAPEMALSSGSREACTVRQFVAYVLVHRCGWTIYRVAAVLGRNPSTISRSVALVKSYGFDDETRELAIKFAKHLFDVLQNCSNKSLQNLGQN